MEQDEAASRISYVTMGMAVVPMVTPTIGGLLDQHFSWQANFWVYFVSGIAVFALLWADYGETHHDRSTSFGQQFANMPELLKSPRFWGYAGVTAFSSGAFFAYLGGAPFVGSVIFKLEPAAVGFFFGAPAIGYMVGNFISARGVRVFGINRLILWGALTKMASIAIALVLFMMNFNSPWAFYAPMTLLGLGNGLVIPNGIAGSLSVRPKLAGTASGLGGALMIGGGAVLSAYAGAQLTEETGAMPLLYIQMTVATLSLVSILLVIRRERRIARY